MRILSAFSAARINGIGSIFPPAVAVITAPILARALGVDGRGDVAGALSPLNLAVAAASLGVPEALTYVTGRYQVYDRRIVYPFIFFLVGFGALLYATVVFSSQGLTGGGDARELMLIGAAGIPLALCLGGVRGMASGLGLWHRVAAERVVASCIRLVAICALQASNSLTARSATLTITITTFCGIVFYLRAFAGVRGSVPLQDSSIRLQLVSFAARVWPGTFAGAMILRLDQFLMVPLSHARELGLYVVAVSVAEVSLILNNSVRDVIFAIGTRGNDLVRLGRAARLSTLVTAFLCLLLAAGANVIISVLFGEAFEPAATATQLLLLGVVLGNPGSIAAAGLAASGYPGTRSVILIGACLVNCSAIVLLVPNWGATGAAVATLLANVCAGGLSVFFARRRLGIGMRQFLLPNREDFQWLLRRFAR